MVRLKYDFSREVGLFLCRRIFECLNCGIGVWWGFECMRKYGLWGNGLYGVGELTDGCTRLWDEVNYERREAYIRYKRFLCYHRHLHMRSMRR